MEENFGISLAERERREERGSKKVVCHRHTQLTASCMHSYQLLSLSGPASLSKKLLLHTLPPPPPSLSSDRYNTTLCVCVVAADTACCCCCCRWDNDICALFALTDRLYDSSPCFCGRLGLTQRQQPPMFGVLDVDSFISLFPPLYWERGEGGVLVVLIFGKPAAPTVPVFVGNDHLPAALPSSPFPSLFY